MTQDGTVLPADLPARPTADSRFADPTREPVLLKLFNRNAKAAISCSCTGQPGIAWNQRTRRGDEGTWALQDEIDSQCQAASRARCRRPRQPLTDAGVGRRRRFIQNQSQPAESGIHTRRLSGQGRVRRLR